MGVDGVFISGRFLVLLLVLTILWGGWADVVPSLCELKVKEKNKLYHYALAGARPMFPHGILSEDGFYKVTANGSTLWFQLCGSMVFNHDAPVCANCEDCGGLHCGMGCGALVSNRIEGYPVCKTLGKPSSTTISPRDEKTPDTGVILKMINVGTRGNCSLSVSIVCDSHKVQGPQTLQLHGACEYTTDLKHPLGCAKIVSSNENGIGWFGTIMIIILCIFGAYFLAGAAFRHFVLHIRGIDVIPNLGFWTSLPHRTQSFFLSTMRRFRGPSYSHRSSYSPVNF